MESYTITKCDDSIPNNHLPAFIYNRYDLWEQDANEVAAVWHYKSNTEDFFYETLVCNNKAELGLWLISLSKDSLKRVVSHCFRTYKKVKTIQLSNVLEFYPGLKSTNHFRITLPESQDELNQRLSRKGRYNIRREKRIIEETVGGCEIVSFAADDPEALKLWDAYFKFKEETYDKVYDLTPSEYCREYHVTHIYALVAQDSPTPLAVILSCESTPIVYLENLSYDKSLQKLSVGQVLYDSYLKLLIEKGFDEVYLLGGNYSYKKRYGSIEETVYNGRVRRCKIQNYIIWLLRKVLRKT